MYKVLGIADCIMQLLTNLHENTDQTRIYHFVSSINQYRDKVAKQVWYAPRTLQDAFERALTLETGLQLAEDLGRSPQVMQVSTSAPCHHNSLEGCVHQVNVRYS